MLANQATKGLLAVLSDQLRRTAPTFAVAAVTAGCVSSPHRPALAKFDKVSGQGTHRCHNVIIGVSVVVAAEAADLVLEG